TRWRASCDDITKASGRATRITDSNAHARHRQQVRCQRSVAMDRNGQRATDHGHSSDIRFIQENQIMAKLRPLGDKILVKRLEAESKTKSGIVLPDTAKEKPRRGKVLSVGEGKRLDTGERSPIGVKKGDEVIFASYAGT